jgi:predicted AlkP superfamily phosphohydrolase/phosphomutase
MRYLRMLSNSVIAGALASAYLAILFLQLNPAFPLQPRALLMLTLSLGVAYGTNVMVIGYALIVLRQLLAIRVLSPGWLSVRLLSWLGTIVAGGAAILMWLNLGGFGNVLDTETARRMAAGAIAMSAAAGLFLVLAFAHIGRRGGGVSATLLSVTVALSLALPVLARGPARAAPSPPQRSAALVRPPVDLTPPAEPAGSRAPGETQSERVVTEGAPPEAGNAAEPITTAARIVMIMLDGASLDVIQPAVAAGRLPGFGRVLDGGVAVHLATLTPTQAEPVWSAVATGRLPMGNGVRSTARYRVKAGEPPIELLPDYCFAQALSSFGFLQEEANTPASLIARPIWSIIGDHGASVDVIGWPLTHPAPPVPGVLVSDRFHRLSPARMAIDGAAEVWPPSLLSEARAALSQPVVPDPASLVSLPSMASAEDREAMREPEPLLADRMHLQLYRALSVPSSRFTAVRFPGVDAVGHYYLRFANPAPFGDVSEEERQRYGRVLEEYYAFLDGIVGEAIARLGPEDLLLVVSAYGMEPLSPGKRLLEQMIGNPQISGTHERAPDGFLLAFGRAVAPARPPRASVLDIAPTILYYMGLPVGRDMDGFARADLFDPAFIAEHPITYIPTHER